MAIRSSGKSVRPSKSFAWASGWTSWRGRCADAHGLGDLSGAQRAMAVRRHVADRLSHRVVATELPVRRGPGDEAGADVDRPGRRQSAVHQAVEQLGGSVPHRVPAVVDAREGNGRDFTQDRIVARPDDPNVLRNPQALRDDHLGEVAGERVAGREDADRLLQLVEPPRKLGQMAREVTQVAAGVDAENEGVDGLAPAVEDEAEGSGLERRDSAGGEAEVDEARVAAGEQVAGGERGRAGVAFGHAGHGHPRGRRRSEDARKPCGPGLLRDRLAPRRDEAVIRAGQLGPRDERLEGARPPARRLVRIARDPEQESAHVLVGPLRIEADSHAARPWPRSHPLRGRLFTCRQHPAGLRLYREHLAGPLSSRRAYTVFRLYRQHPAGSWLPPRWRRYM